MAKKNETVDAALKQAEDDPLLSQSEAAELFNVHRSTIQRWIICKALPSVMLPGGLRKIRYSHLAAIIGVANSPVGS